MRAGEAKDTEAMIEHIQQRVREQAISKYEAD